MNYNEYVMRQLERRFINPDEMEFYSGLTDEEYQELCDQAEHEDMMREMAAEARYEFEREKNW